MAFDFKKEYKEFYLPQSKPTIVTIPSMKYIAVRVQGDPNQEDSEYKKSIIIDEPIEIGRDIYQHPRTTMDKNAEFLTTRPLRVKLLCEL